MSDEITKDSETTEVVDTQGVKAEELRSPQDRPGDKTDPNLLLKSLHEEREKRRQLEERLLLLEQASISPEPSEEDEYDTDEDLKKEVGTLRGQVTSLQETLTINELKTKYPVLAENLAEFHEFKKDYPRTKLENVVKVFLAEKDLLEVKPARKGLEQPTGGPKVSNPTDGYTVEEARRIRENEPKLYEKLVRERKLKIISR